MAELLILVDLANLPVLRGLHRPNPALIGARLDPFFSDLSDTLTTQLTLTFPDLKFRLYDGWFDEDGRGTELYQMVRRHLADTFPTRRRKYRAFVEVADAPLASPRDRLFHTFRTQPGLTRHHVAIVTDPPTGCFSPTACAIHHLRTWVKGHCPQTDCTVLSNSAAHYREQKLVDTTLVADLVWAASRNQPVVAVTDDEDVVPGLLTARAFRSSVSWACRAPRPRGPYADLVLNNGVTYIHAGY